MDDVLRNDTNQSSSSAFEIPFDVIELPSRGKLYKGTTLEGMDSIEVHYLTAKEEDILTSPNLIQSGKLLDVLLASVLKNKKIKPEDFLLGDRNTILVWLRTTGYGEDYPVQVQCEHCGHEFVNTFDLSSLDIKELPVEPDDDGLFTCELPSRKNTIRFSLLTCGDEQKIQRKIDDTKKLTRTQVNPASTIRMRFSIREVDGNSDAAYISRYVDTMPVKDSRVFRKKFAEIEPGTVMEQEMTCPECGERSDEAIPIRANFFWPDTES